MINKDNWQGTVTRFQAWLDFQEMDRPVMILTAPEGSYQGPPPPADMLRRWTDPDYAIPATEAWMKCTRYLGESYPSHWVNLGPGILGAYLGAEPVYDASTGWFPPLGRELQDLDLQWKGDSHWWHKTLELTRASVEAGRGRWITGITDLGGTVDVLAALRGTEDLCMDLVENPEEAALARDKVLKCWKNAYSSLADVVQPAAGGTSTWLGVFSSRRTYPLQCDFSCMISPRMFRDYVMPEIARLCRWLDTPVYHLDGPGAVKHLDALLEIPELRAVQWVQGAGAPRASEWLPLAERVLAAGKSILLYVEPDEVAPITTRLGSRGVALCTGAATVQDGLDLIRLSERAASQHRRSHP